MSTSPDHRIIRAEAQTLPGLFRAFAVRSDEPLHAWDARAPYGRVHVVHTRFLDRASLASLASEGHARIGTTSFAEVDYAATTLADLAAAAPRVPDLVGGIAAALHATGVLGADLAMCRDVAAARIDYLGTSGAGFHNDVGGHWTRCLF